METNTRIINVRSSVKAMIPSARSSASITTRAVIVNLTLVGIPRPSTLIHTIDCPRLFPNSVSHISDHNEDLPRAVQNLAGPAEFENRPSGQTFHLALTTGRLSYRRPPK